MAGFFLLLVNLHMFIWYFSFLSLPLWFPSRFELDHWKMYHAETQCLICLGMTDVMIYLME